MKVLIVEDEDILRKIYKRKFQNSEFDVEVATNGEEGVAKMKSVHPDLVLMDIVMPKLNGLDALDVIKRDTSIKDIPIIMITNLSQVEDATLALKKGAADYIVKSDLTPSQIVAKARTLLSSKKS